MAEPKMLEGITHTGLTHAEAIRIAIDNGCTHGNSVYGYHPRTLKRMLKDAQDEFESGWHTERNWVAAVYGDGDVSLCNANGDTYRASEKHGCWKNGRK
jgi:hypothetical protein